MAGTRLKAVEMVRAIRDAIYEETKDLSREELKAYFERGSATPRAELPEEPTGGSAKSVVNL